MVVNRVRDVGRVTSQLSRARYFACLATIVLGLAVHLGGAMLGPAVRDRLGDALGAMIVWWLAALAPAARPLLRNTAALGICVAVEVSQLYHAAALDAFRNTMVGHLVLGSGFDPGDLVAYTVGVLVAAAIDHSVVRRPTRRAS
jgi:hypothetical protein